MFSIILISSAIILGSLQCNCQLEPRYIEGSLSSSWNLNLTFFTRHLDGNILYFVDYERNNLIMTIDNKSSVISIRYNKATKTNKLKELCGCESCADTMISLQLTSLSQKIQVTCNHHSSDNVERVNIENKDNKHLTKDMKVKIEKIAKNNIYTWIPIENIGCLMSLYYNGQRILFQQVGTQFLPTCPRNCTSGLCNDGKCWPSYPLGSVCDCSATELSGPYCNNSMLTYSRGSINSYTKISPTNAMHIKLSWHTTSFDKKYCLLNFLTQYGKVTFSTYQNFLMLGHDIISFINFNRINFIDVDVTDASVLIKVNNNVTQARPALFGNMTINVGFTKEDKQCDTFEGLYYFVFNSSQLRLLESSNIEVPPTKKTSIPNNILYILIVGFGVILATCLMIVVYFSMYRPIKIKEPFDTILTSEDKSSLDAESGFYEKVKESESYDYITADTYSKPT